jgi:hypothetical protein
VPGEAEIAKVAAEEPVPEEAVPPSEELAAEPESVEEVTDDSGL